MNPGFSPAASSAAFQASGFSPAFFKPTAPPAAGGAGGIYFPRHAGETVGEFQQAPAFPAFVQEFHAHIESINLFATEYLGDEAHGVHVALGDFCKKLFGTAEDFFGDEKEILYGAGKRLLEQIAMDLADAGIDLARRRTCVVELAEGIQKCAGGAAVNLAEAAQTLQLARGNAFFRARNEAAAALITEAYLHLTQGTAPVAPKLKLGNMPVQHVPVDFEIHCATSLRNAVAERLGLPKHADPTADHCTFSGEAIEYCLQYVLRRLTPAGLAKELADEYLQAFRKPVMEALAQSAEDGDRPFNYEKWSAQLSSAREELKNYGDIGMNSLVTATDPHFREVRLNGDSTLVALDILTAQRDNGMLADAYRPETLVRWRHGENNISIRHLSEQLAWAVENGDAHLLGTKHLLLISPANFEGTEASAQLIAGNVVRNTAPEVLQACLSVEWLSILDTVEVFAKWTPAALSRYLKRHAMHIAMLPRIRMLSIARGIVACGKTADLDLCVQHGRTLFEPLPDCTAPQEFFRIALLRGDAPMLNLLLRRLDEGVVRSGRIRQQAGAILAAADAQGVVASAAVYVKREPNPVLSAYFNIAIVAACNRLITPAQLAGIVAGRNVRGTAGLAFAMQHNDCRKIQELGHAVVDAFHHGLFDGKQCAALLTAVTRLGVPALLVAINENRLDAIKTFGGVVVAANMQKAIDRAQVFALLQANAWEDCSALLLAAMEGKSAALLALGNVFSVAAAKGALSNEQVYRLLQGPVVLQHQLLELTLCRGHADTAKALANLLLNLYMEDVLDPDQIRALLSGKTCEGTQDLLDALTRGRRGEAAAVVLGNIVMAAEAVIRRKEGMPTLFLTASEGYPGLNLRTLAVARSDAGLGAVAADIRALRSQLQAGRPVCGEVLAQANLLARQMLKSRVGLFFEPGAPSEGPRLFGAIAQEWEWLDRELRPPQDPSEGAAESLP